MRKIEFKISAFEIENLDALSAQEQLLVTLSREMTYKAYAPYSKFFVGAALLLANGQIVKGSNQENAAYPSGLCAERVAVFAASAQYPDTIIDILAISARAADQVMDHPITPCGACRQVILEYEFRQKKPIKVILSGETGKILLVNSVNDLLPFSFSPYDLT